MSNWEGGGGAPNGSGASACIYIVYSVGCYGTCTLPRSIFFFVPFSYHVDRGHLFFRVSLKIFSVIFLCYANCPVFFL